VIKQFLTPVVSVVILIVSATLFGGDDVDPKAEFIGVGEHAIDIVPPAASELVIDLGSAIRLAEAQNPRIALAREIVNEAMAAHKEARALLLPSLTAGTDYHLHTGVLQTSFGQIRQVNSQSLYMGGGTQTVGSQTIGIPAVRIFAHAGDAYYLPLAAAQMVTVRAYESNSVNNVTLLDVADRYLNLVAAEARREALQVSVQEFDNIEKAQQAYARVGQGREADYHRARADRLLIRLEEEQAQEETAVAAADLSRLLHLDPGVRLVTPSGPIEMLTLVDETSDVESLVDRALRQRPEVISRTAEIGAAEYRWRDERTRPWLPLISVGFSGGAYGGGSNRQDLGVSSMYTTTQGRTDLDVMAIWTVQNLGVGNHALQGNRKSEMDQAILQRALTIARIRREVAERQAQVRSRRRTVAVSWNQLAAAERGAREELMLTRSGEALPIEALNSMARLATARQQLLTAVIEYNRAELQLFVALGTSLSGTL
jgi:outer membrane protein TolC